VHGDDDQIVPIADSALLSSKLLEKATLKVYEKFPHGMCTTHAEVINPHARLHQELSGSTPPPSAAGKQLCHAGGRPRVLPAD
jgi:fermentation-respiration switch protein FrsA (DUF1100 family)